jgi:single-strand DNA-binding protein
MSINITTFVGHIGAEPKISHFQTGKKVARFSVAVNNYSKNGQTPPTWIDCEMWDAAVERLIKCQEKGGLKGRQVAIQGALALNTYTKTVGNVQIPERKLYVKVQSFQLLGKLEGSTEEAPLEATVMEEAAEPAPLEKARKKA